MKYFALEIDRNYIAPQILEWYGRIDRNTLKQKARHKLPKHLLFQVGQHMQMMFTDIILTPCFIVGDMVQGVIGKYDPFLESAQLILHDGEQKESMSYHMYFLDRLTLEKKNYTELNRTAKNPLSIGKEQIGDRVLLEVEDNLKTHIVMRLDLLESILRRGASGIGAREIKTF